MKQPRSTPIAFSGTLLGMLTLASWTWAQDPGLPGDAPHLASASGDALERTTPTIRSIEQLARMSWPELENLYRCAAPGPIPAGYLRGLPIYCPDSLISGAQGRVARALWKGKWFCPEHATLTNQWLAGKAVRARVDYGCSWLDGQPSIIMDYRGTSPLIWSNVRDEIREVAPGIYLGLMYRHACPPAHYRMFFALDARRSAPACRTCPQP